MQKWSVEVPTHHHHRKDRWVCLNWTGQRLITVSWHSVQMACGDTNVSLANENSGEGSEHFSSLLIAFWPPLRGLLGRAPEMALKPCQGSTDLVNEHSARLTSLASVFTYPGQWWLAAFKAASSGYNTSNPSTVGNLDMPTCGCTPGPKKCPLGTQLPTFTLGAIHTTCVPGRR